VEAVRGVEWVRSGRGEEWWAPIVSGKSKGFSTGKCMAV
jgi:hypothetical protein